MSGQQEFNRSIYGDIAGGDIVRNTTVNIAHQTVNHDYGSAPPAQLARHAPLAPPARLLDATHSPPPLTLAQKKLLQLMKPLGKLARIEVLDFMRQQFGTAMIRELQPPALAQTYRFVMGHFLVKR